MREGDCCPTATIVELVGNLNMGKPVQDGSDRPKPRVGLLYDHGELCLYMMQIVDGEKLDSILKLTLADDGKIARIDMCDTGFFSFRKFEESEG